MVCCRFGWFKGGGGRAQGHSGELFTCCGDGLASKLFLCLGYPALELGSSMEGQIGMCGKKTYDLALIFLLLRLRRRVRFFFHLALILNLAGDTG